jgi:hypothetical protein
MLLFLLAVARDGAANTHKTAAKNAAHTSAANAAPVGGVSLRPVRKVGDKEVGVEDSYGQALAPRDGGAEVLLICRLHL